MMKLMKRLGRDLLYGGSRKISPFEKTVLDSLREHITENDRNAISIQLNHLDRIQRQTDRVSAFYFEDIESVPKTEDLSYEHSLGVLKVNYINGKATVKVFCCEGVLSSIECTKPVERSACPEILSVVSYQNVKSEIDELDKEEHG